MDERRRLLLGTLGVGLTAGCVSSDEGTSREPTATGTGSASETAGETMDGRGTDDALETDESEETDESTGEAASVEGGWLHANGDRSNTRHAPSVSVSDQPAEAWRLGLDGESVVTYRPLIDGDRGVVLTQNIVNDPQEGTAVLVGFDPATGEETWRRGVAYATGFPASISADAAGVYAHHENGFAQYAWADGSIAQTFSWPTEGGASSKTRVADGTVYATRGRLLGAFDTETGEQRWQVELQHGANFEPPFVVSPDGVVAAGDGWIAFDTDGTRRWQIPDDAGSAPIVSGDRIFLPPPVGESTVRAASLTDGSVRWEASLPETRGGYALATDGTRLYAAGSDGTAAFTVADGQRVWLRDESRPGDRVPTVVGETLVTTAYGESSLTAFDAATGETRWTLSLPQPGGLGVTPVGSTLSVPTLGVEESPAVVAYEN